MEIQNIKMNVEDYWLKYNNILFFIFVYNFYFK